MGAIDKGPNSEQIYRMEENMSHPEQRTLEMKAFCKKVESILLQEGLLDEVREEMAKEIPELVPIEGEREPLRRMLNLFRGVAEVVKKTSGRTFDTVINPCSGSDISSGLSFDCDQLVTVDEGDLFAIYDKTDDTLRSRLKENLRGKLVKGMHGYYSNQGLAAYAMELILNGVDLNSLKITEEKKAGEATMTRLQFNKDGKRIVHTNFSHVYLKNKFDPSWPEDKLIASKIQSIIKQSKQIVLLSKAGGGSMVGPNVATASFWPLLPDHTVVVSDANENESLRISGYPITLKTLKTDRAQQALNELQGGSPPNTTSVDGWTDKHIVYGYATDLRDLEISEVLRH